MEKQKVKGVNLAEILGDKVSFLDAWQYIITENKENNCQNDNFSEMINYLYCTDNIGEWGLFCSLYETEYDGVVYDPETGNELHNCDGALFGIPYWWDEIDTNGLFDTHPFTEYYSFALNHGYTPETFLAEFIKMQREQEEIAFNIFLREENIDVEQVGKHI